MVREDIDQDQSAISSPRTAWNYTNHVTITPDPLLTLS